MKALVSELKFARVERLNVNGAFDIRLYRLPSGNFELLAFMKLQFFFHNNHPHKWQDKEDDVFISSWQELIHEVWGNKTLKVLNTGEQLSLNFDFHIQKGGWMYDHWEINVKKIGKGEFNISYVQPLLNSVQLDSEDLNCSGSQRAAVHEFGHMIGLLDEYKHGHHVHDYQSIMHTGEKIRDRHFAHFVDWAENEISKNEVVT